MVNININGISLQVKEGTTILEAAASVGMKIPTLCFMKNCNEIGACRICVVQIEGIERLHAACNTVCQEGMVIHTNNPIVREARRTNLQLLLSQHKVNCPSCERNNNCELQRLSAIYTVGDKERYRTGLPVNEWDQTAPLIRDEDKCIRCYRCVAVCEKIQSLNIWDMIGSGPHTTIGVSGNREFKYADCALCGQCITHCPCNALHARDDTDKVIGRKGMVKSRDSHKITVVQIAPAVRAGWGEEFGLPPEIATERRLAAALRRVGFDYVFDTNFSADLTIMEEGTEFLGRMKEPDKYKWPMFTSCCPGWVRFLKSQYPDMVDQLSTAKSPQQMFGAITKSYFAYKIGVAPEDIYCISVMPCTAKKAECEIPNINDAAEGVKDVDLSITTREMCRIFKATQLDVTTIPEEDFDSPLGTGTGAAVIFGATGGVMEAALRTCYYVMTGENPNADETFKAVRATGTDQPWVEAEYDVAGIKVKAAVVSGLGNTRKLIRAIRKGEVFYHFVEVMACPGGCAGGGGQPIHYNEERAAARSKVLYDYDQANKIRFSHENPDVIALYDDYLKEPCGHLSHKLLHTDHHGWDMPATPTPDEDVIFAK